MSGTFCILERLGRGVGERSELRGGGAASEASLPPESSQVAAEGSGLRVGDNEAIFGTYTFLINESHVYVKLC